MIVFRARNRIVQDFKRSVCALTSFSKYCALTVKESMRLVRVVSERELVRLFLNRGLISTGNYIKDFIMGGHDKAMWGELIVCTET
jgi:hypothetical protein